MLNKKLRTLSLYCMICIYIFIATNIWAQNVTSNSQEEVKKAVDNISELIRRKDRTEQAAKIYSAGMKIIGEDPAHSVLIMLDKIQDPRENVDVKLHLSRSAYRLLSEKKLKIDVRRIARALRAQDDAKIQANLIRLIGLMGDSAAIKNLLSYADSEDENVRVAFAQVLGKIQDIDTLSNLERMAKNDPSYLARIASIRSLGKFKQNSRAIRMLKEAFRIEHDRVGNNRQKDAAFNFDKELALMAIVKSMGEVESLDSVPLLMDILSNTNYQLDVRKNAAIALGKLRAIDAEELLLNIMKNDSGGLCFHAAESLAAITGGKYLKDLITVRDSKADDFIKMRLTKIIEKIESN